MMSFPMEASVVHLQSLVARTAHRLWALNLHTVRERDMSPRAAAALRDTLEELPGVFWGRCDEHTALPITS